MKNFITILENTVVASTQTVVDITDKFENISGQSLLEQIKKTPCGVKDGSHFLRTGLNISNNGICMPRNDSNIFNNANVILIDCDKQIDAQGNEIIGAVDPLEVHRALKSLNIGHVIYGSYSHYQGGKGNRYRIILTTNKPYNRAQLRVTIEQTILQINQSLKNSKLAYAKENNTFSQPWFYPRKPANSDVKTLYFEYPEGLAINTIEQITIPTINHRPITTYTWSGGQISPIKAYNEQNNLTKLLAKYGYSLELVTKNYEKWLSPESTSGKAGITVKDDKFFSHHDDPFNDGYWHDAFDLMRIKEGLPQAEAIVYAAQNSTAPNGETVDQFNKKSSKYKQTSSVEKSDGNIFESIEPWHEEIDPKQLLDQIKKLISDHVICDVHAQIAASLWIVFTWIIEISNTAPIAIITAPEKRCGKSTFLSLIAKLVKRPLLVSNITPAAIFRTIDLYCPTMLIDEADTFMKDNEVLKGIINSGHTKETANVIRLVGNNHEPRCFNTFCAKAISGIGRMPDTISDRSIILELRRKKSDEKIKRLRYSLNEIMDIKRKLARFSIDYSKLLQGMSPNIPDELNDRQQDNWEILLTIADLAGSLWSDMSRRAAKFLSSSDNEVKSIRIQLLENIQRILSSLDTDRIKTESLLNQLCSDPELPWKTYDRGEHITSRQLACLLKNFKIESKQIRFDHSTTCKGYYKSHFTEAFERYLHNTRNCETTLCNQD